MQQNIKSKYQGILEQFKAVENIFPSTIKYPYKTFDREITTPDGKKSIVKSIINDNGKAEFDLDKMINLYNMSMSNKEVFDNLVMASLNQDEVHYQFYMNQALSQLFYNYVGNNSFGDSNEAFEVMMSRNPLKSIADDEELKSLGLNFKDADAKLRQMKSEWDQMQERLKGKRDYQDNSSDYLSFREKTEQADFYNRMKLRWLDDIEGKVEDKTAIDAVRQDALSTIELLENKNEREKLYKEYLKSKENLNNLNKQYAESLVKDPKSIETRKLRYLLNEEEMINGSKTIHDVFTITQKPTEYGELGLKNQHYFNIAADAIVGIRLEAAMEGAKSGANSIKDVIDILEKPVRGTTEIRGKNDITQEDIDKVKEIIPIAKQVIDKITIYSRTV